jgi:hypothetical protein
MGRISRILHVFGSLVWGDPGVCFDDTCWQELGLASVKEISHGVQNVPVVGTDDHNSRAVQEIPSDRDGTP